jgi:PKD repeat protein
MIKSFAGLATVLTLMLFAPQAQAVVVQADPTWPISNAVTGLPPIPTLPTATASAPPADQIADPVTPAASCGGWYLQSNYGNRWPAGSTWWEYRCTADSYFYYDPCSGGGACDAFCPSCYEETTQRTDYFYWDGSEAVFYGQDYFDSFTYTQTGDPPYITSVWWDAPTGQWYSPPTAVNVAPAASFTFSCSDLTCAFDASASSDSDGTIVDYSWSFADGTTGSGVTTSHAYASAGTYNVTLTVSDNSGASGAVTKSITVRPANVPPTASFTFTCTGLACSFNGSASTDSDGMIASYSWAFGDGAAASSPTAWHTYAHSGTYMASLSAVDDRGASTTVAKDVTVTNLAPTAAFTVTCSSLRCTLDASASADPDGTIATFGWTYGDSTGASVVTTSTTHNYPKAGNYTVTLTVTDNDGASTSTSQHINPISLSARAYKQNGQQKIDLAWNVVTGSSYDLYRNGAKIATVSTTAYTDTVGRGSGSYTYKVCAPAAASCSNDASVSF